MTTQHNHVQDLVSEVTFRNVENMLQVFKCNLFVTILQAFSNWYSIQNMFLKLKRCVLNLNCFKSFALLCFFFIDLGFYHLSML